VTRDGSTWRLALPERQFPANEGDLSLLVHIGGTVFAKTYFSAKISCTYTMNYLHQEKCLRDHGAFLGWNTPIYPN
jgi:hypothetical protein